MPGFKDWQLAIAEIIAVGYNVQPSEFMQMRLDDLQFWREIAHIISESNKKAIKKP
jgi:hypothetical protein